MDVDLIVGLVVGGIGGGVGLLVVLYVLGIFQYLGGKKPGPYAVSKEVLMEELQALNDPSKPYRIIKGENTDLVAEWKITDASWHGVFGQNRLRKAYRALLLLDEARHSVRCFEVLGSVRWNAGPHGLIPRVRYRKRAFSGGILFRKSHAIEYGINHPKFWKVGKVQSYKFHIDEIRTPVRDTVLLNDWEWIPVAARQHATYGKEHAVLSSLREAALLCQSCGSEIELQDNFCGECGQRVSWHNPLSRS